MELSGNVDLSGDNDQLEINVSRAGSHSSPLLRGPVADSARDSPNHDAAQALYADLEDDMMDDDLVLHGDDDLGVGLEPAGTPDIDGNGGWGGGGGAVELEDHNPGVSEAHMIMLDDDALDPELHDSGKHPNPPSLSTIIIINSSSPSPSPSLSSSPPVAVWEGNPAANAPASGLAAADLPFPCSPLHRADWQPPNVGEAFCGVRSASVHSGCIGAQSCRTGNAPGIVVKAAEQPGAAAARESGDCLRGRCLRWEQPPRWRDDECRSERRL